MLVLTRRAGETITIVTPNGDTLKVTVADVRGSQVRIGVHAPTAYVVQREAPSLGLVSESESH